MMRRSPLKQKRDKPRRKAPERVQHVRTKPKAGSPATAEEKAHIARVAAMPCLISGEKASIHHVTGSIHGGRFARSHKCVVPLAPRYHQKVFDPKASDPISVEGLSHRGFWIKYGIDLEAVGNQLWREGND